MQKNRLFGSFVLIAAFAMLFGCGKKSEENTQQPQPNPTPGPGPNPQPKRPPLGEPKYRVTTKQLLTESVADKKSLAKYYGSIVEVSGIALSHAAFDLEDVLQSPPSARVAGYGAVFVMLEMQPNANPGGSDSISVAVRGLDRSLLPRILKGQKVKVKGRAEKFFNDGLLLKDSELVEGDTDNSIRMKSEEVAAEAAKSLEALVKRCDERTLVISGSVIGKVNEGDDEFVELKGDGKTRVLCRLHNSAPFLFSNGFAMGDQVVFTATVSTTSDLQQPGRVIVSDCIPIHRAPTAAEATKRL